MTDILLPFTAYCDGDLAEIIAVPIRAFLADLGAPVGRHPQTRAGRDRLGYRSTLPFAVGVPGRPYLMRWMPAANATPRSHSLRVPQPLLVPTAVPPFLEAVNEA
ncbi:hypothetical protein [Nonomuraea sp. NPDC003727]